MGRLAPQQAAIGFEHVVGVGPCHPNFWNSISANAFLRDLKGPIQIHHGTGDHEVPVEFSEMLYDEMLEDGQPVEFYTYKGDNHNISNYFSLAMERTIQFFDRYLKGISARDAYLGRNPTPDEIRLFRESLERPR